MALSQEKLRNFRNDLTSRRNAIAAELRRGTNDLLNNEEMYSDAIDQASADADKSFALQMKSRERNLLGQIDEALRRMDGGKFGSCERCAESISEARIKAFPFTTLCIDCKAELESEEHRLPGRY